MIFNLKDLIETIADFQKHAGSVGDFNQHLENLKETAANYANLTSQLVIPGAAEASEAAAREAALEAAAREAAPGEKKGRGAAATGGAAKATSLEKKGKEAAAPPREKVAIPAEEVGPAEAGRDPEVLEDAAPLEKVFSSKEYLKKIDLSAHGLKGKPVKNLESHDSLRFVTIRERSNLRHTRTRVEVLSKRMYEDRAGPDRHDEIFIWGSTLWGIHHCRARLRSIQFRG